MGGRGASSGASRGGGGGGNYIGNSGLTMRQMVEGVQNIPPTNTSAAQTGDYTDDNNPDLLKFQAQTPDKTASFLSSIDKQPVTYDANTGKYQLFGSNDAYGFYNNPFQKLVLKLGLNKKPMVVSENDFNTIQQQTGAEVFYRGFSSRASANTFLNSDNFHSGTGVYGDGLYFANNTSTASTYGGGAMTKMMLSPKARVVDYNALVKSMPTGKLRRSLSIAGSTGQRSYGSNDGESQWALKQGYNVIKVDRGNGNPYYIALTRDALIVSSKLK